MKNFIVLFFSVTMLASCHSVQKEGAKTAATNKDSVLYRFDLKAIAASGSKAVTWQKIPEFNDSVLLLKPLSRGMGIMLKGFDEGVPYDKAKYLVMDVWHDQDFSVIMMADIFKIGEQELTDNHKRKSRMWFKTGIFPKLRTQMIFPLSHLDANNVFPKKNPRQLKNFVIGRRMEKNEIDQIWINVQPVDSGYMANLYINDIYITDTLPAPLPALKEPIVDLMGQWKSKNWEGKINSKEEMVAKLTKLEKEVSGAAFPEGWSKYGGLKSKQFKATGFFRTQWDGKRWWLADPEGYAFLSTGMDCVGEGVPQRTENMDDLFTPDPAASNEKGKTNFFKNNLKAAFGQDYRPRWESLTANLLKSWRFNTVGNWSDQKFIRNVQMPYVHPLHDFPSTKVKIFRDFPDVFDPEYRSNSVQFAMQLDTLKNDPYMIGYFLNNEPHWGHGAYNLAFEMIGTDQTSFTKKKMISWLEKKYKTIDAFNKAWNLSLKKITDLEVTVLRDFSQLTKISEADLKEFSGTMVQEYIRVVCEEVKKVDQNHLNLGLRYATLSSELCYQAGAMFDVFSLNGYDFPGPPNTADILKKINKPVIIGEFHFGAVDAGLPASGIVAVASQQDRGTAYSYYVENGFARPEIVGIHHFQWLDQPLLGRSDGENYNIGFMDVCQQPYQKLAASAKASHERMYNIGMGKEKPTSKMAKTAPAICY